MINVLEVIFYISGMRLNIWIFLYHLCNPRQEYVEFVS